MKQVSLAKARDRLSALVNDAAHGGQRIVLSSRGRPKAALIGMEDLDRLERGSAAATTISQEMLRWIGRVERTLTDRQLARDASTDALRDVREERHARRNGVSRRQPRPQSPRQRGR